jgi:hypothetical protein
MMGSSDDGNSIGIDSNNALPGHDDKSKNPSEQLPIESLRLLLDDHPSCDIALDDLLSLSHSSHSSRSSLETAEEDEDGLLTNVEPDVPDVDFEGQNPTFPSVHKKVAYTSQDAAMLSLIQILDSAKAPRGLFDQVTKWITKTLAAGVDLSRPISSRTSFVKRLKKRFPAPEPTVTTMQLETESSQRPLQPHGEERQTVNIYHWDFVSQLQDLLADHHLFGDLDNLVVNSVDEFLPYPDDPNEPIDEVLTGRWYQKYVVEAMTNCDRQFIIPIIMAIDKTPIAGNGRYSLEPLMFTTALLKNCVRENPRAWRHLGLVPDFEEKSKARRASYTMKAASKGRAQRNYHGALAIVLESFIKAQEHGILHLLALGKTAKVLSLQCPLAFVITDGLGADAIVGRMGTTGRKDGTGRRCRGCDCDTANHSDPYHQCNQLQQEIMEDMYLRAQSSDTEIVKKAKKELHFISQHPVNNAFWPAVYLPSRPGGIYSSLPVDPMHAVEEGILNYVLVVFLGTLSVDLQAQVDDLASQMFQQCPSQTERRNFPRTNFTKGITSLSFLAAHERVGLILSLYLLGTTDKGATLLCSRGSEWNSDAPPQGQRHLSDDKMYIADFIDLLELLLCFHAYYKSGTFWSRNDNTGMEKRAQEAVAYTLTAVQQVLPRNQGHKWGLQKMHDTAGHLTKDISEHGRSANFDTSGPERNHKSFAKDPARTSQKRGNSIFLDQSSSRINENQVFHNTCRAWGMTPAKDLVHNEDDNRRDSRAMMFGTKLPLYKVRIRPSMEDVNVVLGQVTWVGKGRSRPHIHPIVTQFLVKNYGEGAEEQYPLHTIDCYTEVIVGEQRFRAHPNYDSNRPWYDWVFTQWELPHRPTLPELSELVTSIGSIREESDDQDSEETQQFYYVPAKLLCFIRVPLKQDSEDEEEKSVVVDMEQEGGYSISAVVHSCEDGPVMEKETHITRRWVPEYEKETPQRLGETLFRPVLRIIPVSSISCSVLVVEPSPGIHEVRPDHFEITEVRERRTVWANSFIPAAHGSNLVRSEEERSGEECSEEDLSDEERSDEELSDVQSIDEELS